ncbi:MAG: hypothetical protein E7G59_01800 [Cutibacterium granulosum]|uniref:hypothetical protein n=1 Tax=Cutibacterium granulosum TaxID=33011 RepID=UPI0029143C6E|nr:hypothetical protein [Cutibacterium granulosum]MDU3821030.1 hypothetical protein [Cutibacterium granulosum]
MKEAVIDGSTLAERLAQVHTNSTQLLYCRDKRRRRRRILGGDSGPNLGDIVALPHLRELRDSGPLSATPIFDSLSELDHDHLIWCTGFRPALGPFRHLMRGREPAVKNLHLVGYGNWTGDGSATLMGVGPFAKHTARVVAGRVDEARQHEF